MMLVVSVMVAVVCTQTVTVTMRENVFDSFEISRAEETASLCEEMFLMALRSLGPRKLIQAVIAFIDFWSWSSPLCMHQKVCYIEANHAI